jgi:Transglycosylase-like domain
MRARFVLPWRLARPPLTRCRHARQAVPFYRRITWTVQARWLEDRADRTPLVRGRSCAWARYAADEWVARARNAIRSHSRYLRTVVRQLRLERTRLYEKWRCIHEHEGAWNANTGNGYYGGLQMDMSFQAAHGPQFLARWGTADKWPVWAQLEAAEDAYRTRGFNPWPNTARVCGLL